MPEVDNAPLITSGLPFEVAGPRILGAAASCAEVCYSPGNLMCYDFNRLECYLAASRTIRSST